MTKILNQTSISMVTLILTIVIFGSMMIFSSTFFPTKTPSQLFYNQIIFYILGFIIFFLISFIDYRLLKSKLIITLVLIITFILLIAVLFIGENIYGAQRWIDLGFFSIQPSELAKISLIIILGYIFNTKISNKKNQTDRNISAGIYSKIFNKLTLPYIFSFILILSFSILILAQRSLGNTLLIILIYISILFSQLKFNKKILIIFLNFIFGLLCFLILQNYNENSIILLLVILGINIFLLKKITINKIFPTILLIFGFISLPFIQLIYNSILADYQKQRIETFLNPDSELSKTLDYNRSQSITAIGSGRFSGNGFLQGTLTSLNLLPFAYTDFVFASFSEQFGFIGSIFLIIIYSLLIVKIFKIYSESQDNFAKVISFGVIMMISLNTIQHIGMNIGLLPISGIPLPLMSYGGSSILTIFLGLGLVHSINIRNRLMRENVINLSRKFGVERVIMNE